MSDGLIGHYLPNGDYKRVSRLESAKINHEEGLFDVTYDIGVEFKDLEKEVKDFYAKNGYTLKMINSKKYEFTLDAKINKNER